MTEISARKQFMKISIEGAAHQQGEKLNVVKFPTDLSYQQGSLKQWMICCKFTDISSESGDNLMIDLLTACFKDMNLGV